MAYQILRLICHLFALFKIKIKAGAEGIEPSLTVLETAVLPLNYAPLASAMYFSHQQRIL